MIPPRVVRNTGLVLAGFVMGLFGLMLGLWFYLQAARVDEVRTQVGAEVRIARDAIESIEVLEEDAIRFTLRDVVLFDEAGDTIIAMPTARLTLDALTINGEGAIEFYDVDLIEPYGRFIQSPAGDWNFTRAMSMTAAGEPIESQSGRPLLFRDVRIEDGRMVVAMPVEAAGDAEGAFPINLPLTQLGGSTYQRYSISNLQAELPEVRVGRAEGWRAEVAALSGDVAEPNLRITQLQGWAEQAGEDGIRFELGTLRFGDSRLAGSGLVRLTEVGPLYDIEIQAAPLMAADARSLFPNLPEEGVARFALDLESISPERHALTFSDMEVIIADSRILGRIGIAMGGELSPSLTAAELELAPLDLLTLERLGFVSEVPFLGGVTGQVSTVGATPGFADVDLTGTVVPRDQAGATPSTIFASGEIALAADANEPLQLEGVTLSFQPLYLAAFRGFAPELADRLRGELRGSIALGGTLDEVRFSGGELAYQVGDAAATRVSDLAGRLALDPLSYEVSATAVPLALATLTELFPGLPFREGTLSGPIEISGDATGFQIESDLTGPSGGIQFAGSVDLEEIPTFDLRGEVRAFAAGMILRPDVPVEGPLTGTFSVRGSTRQLAFDVDLAQAEGSFALAGTANLAAEPARFDVAGNVSNFRIGALLGDPELFPDPMTGPIAIAGGGGEPYSFNLDLEGDVGRLDLSGVFRSTAIPSYEIQGYVVGLDLNALPLPAALPSTSLTGSVDIQGRGVDLETLEGRYAFDLGTSRVSNQTLDAALGRIQVVGGIANVDTLHVQLERSTLAASGSWGLRTPAAEPLRFAIASPDLSSLSRLIAPSELVPPQLAGSLQAAGEIGGSVEFPVINGQLEGRNIRYEDWRASTLSLTVDAVRDPAVGWGGQLALDGEDLILPGIENFETVRLEVNGNEASLAIGLFARRDTESDIALSGILQIAGMRPVGIGLQTMSLRAGGAVWDLLGPARLRYVSAEGLIIENLVLQRGGTGVPGLLSIDGMLPPTGDADLRITAENLDLADLRRITDAAPAVEGLLSMNMVLEGPVASPEMSIDARLDQLLFEGVQTESVTFEATYSGESLIGSVQAVIAGRPLFQADMSVPMLLSMEGRLIPSIEFLEAAPLSAMIRADSLPLDIAASMVPGVREGVGVARAEIDIAGTIATPNLQGWVRVEDGGVTIDRLATRYSEIQADIAMAQNQATINNFSARNKGTIVASGSVGFPSASTPLFDLTVILDDFLVMDDPEVAQLTASGDLSLSGPAADAVLRGQLRIHQSTFRVPELGQDEPALELAYADLGQIGPIPDADAIVPPPIMGDIRIDGLQVGFEESVWLESDELRVQIEGDLVVYRTGEEVRVFGALQALRGTYALEISAIVREFDIISGRVQFFGTGEINPALDIVAGYRVRSSTVGRGGDLTILVQLTGTLLSPRLRLTADTPVPLSEGDLISYLLFGQPSFELGGVTQSFAEQVLVQEVVGGILAAELERPILRAGICDWVRVRPGATAGFRGLLGVSPLTNAAIECGWELAPSLFLTAQASLGGLVGADFTNGQVGMEWQIDDQWSLEWTYGAVPRDAALRIFDTSIQTQFSTDLRREWEYGRPSRRGTIDLTPGLEDDGQMGPPPPPPTPEPLDEPEPAP